MFSELWMYPGAEGDEDLAEDHDPEAQESKAAAGS